MADPSNAPADLGAAVCVVCGDPLEGRRRHAGVCSGACRADKSRARRILGGETVDGASSLAELFARRRKRTASRLAADPGHQIVGR